MRTGGFNGSREFVAFGGEGVVWLMNAIGTGVAGDLVLGDSRRFRAEPFVAWRLLHLGKAGAVALRTGALWDSQDRWFAQLGLSLQFNGVRHPNVNSF